VRHLLLPVLLLVPDGVAVSGQAYPRPATLSKSRAILVRYDKKAVNYLGLVDLDCTFLWYRRCWRLGLLR